MNPLNKIGCGLLLACGLVFGYDHLQPEGIAPQIGGTLQVVIWRDTDNEHSLPPEQTAIFASEDLKEYLDGVTPVMPDQEHAYRIWPTDVNVEYSIPEWKEMKANHKTPAPSLQIKKGKRYVYDGPLPKTVKGVKDKVGSYK